MDIACVAIDQNLDSSAQVPAVHIMKSYAEELSRDHEVQYFGRFGGGPLPKTFDLVLLCPAWFMMREGSVRATQNFLENNHQSPICVVTDDLRLVRWHSSHSFPKAEDRTGRRIRAMLVHNFRNLRAADLTYVWDSYSFQPYVPVHLLKSSDKQARFRLGYYGWFTPERWRLLCDLDMRDVVLMGPGWERQDVYPFCYPENVRWPFLPEMIRTAEWIVTACDEFAASAGPSFSRFAECWAAGRPLLVHESHETCRPDLDWEPVRPWTWSTQDQLHRIAERWAGREGAVAQAQWAGMFHQMYIDKPGVGAIEAWA